MVGSLLGGLAALAAVGAEACQAGVRIELSLLAPKGSRIDPFKGMEQIARNAAGAWAMAGRMLVCAGLFGLLVADSLAPGLSVGWLAPPERIGGLMSEVGVRLAGVLWIVAVWDYGWKRRRYLREFSMSNDQVRQEHKEEEGDPFVRALRRSMHGSLLFEELKAKVRRSKVIVVE